MGSQRINHTITACRLLLLLQQLIQHQRLTYAGINQIFQANPTVGRPIGSETLTKYIATLRHFGCTIPKASIHNQFHYTLTHYPLPTGLSDSQKAILEEALHGYFNKVKPSTHSETSFSGTEKDSVTSTQNLLRWWLAIPNDATKTYTQKTAALKHIANNKVLFNSKTNEQTTLPLQITSNPTLAASWQTHWQQWWLGGTWVQVTLHNSPQSLTIEPQGFQATDHGCIVTGWEVTSARWLSIPITSILLMHPLPMRSRGRGQRMTFTFKLSGRLAKNYRLYADETELSTNEDPATRIIQSRVNDTDAFITRLMKYGVHCELLSPQWARDTIQQRIHQLMGQPFPSADSQAYEVGSL